jgi:aryl-alcohol dehydrogenase-like predicted oxidoreductase
MNAFAHPTASSGIGEERRAEAQRYSNEGDRTMGSTKQQMERPGGMALLAGRPVGRIGFGAMQLPGRGVLGPPRDRATALAVLRRAVELGVNHIDTAQFYGPDVANELIHAALHPYPEDLVLVSKVGAERDANGGWTPAQRPEQLRAGVQDNLRSLAVERLDVVNLRLLDRDHADRTSDNSVDLDSQLAEMVALRDEGKIGGIGISNVTAEQLRQALPVDLACVQNQYSVLDRSGEPLLELCRTHDVDWVPYFPLGSAFPGLPKVTEHPAVVAAAAALSATPAQVGLAWLLGHDPRVLLIPGTSSLDHLAENLAAGGVQLDRGLATAAVSRRCWPGCGQCWGRRGNHLAQSTRRITSHSRRRLEVAESKPAEFREGWPHQGYRGGNVRARSCDLAALSDPPQGR